MFCGAVALYAVFALTTLNLSLCGHGQAEEITIFPDDERSDITPQASTSETSVWAWGENGCGQLGIGTTTPRRARVPVKVQMSGAIDIACNLASYVVKSDGTVYAWGPNG